MMKIIHIVRLSNRTGAALVITLWILVLVTIVALGITDLVRLERSASASHFERMQASEFARMGVESVSAAILKSTADPNYTWITTPGQIYRGTDALNAASPTQTFASVPIPLSSGFPTNLTPSPDYLTPPNLNVTTFSDSTRHVITEGNDASSTPTVPVPLSMPLKWIYVLEDGTLDTSETPNTTNAANPIVGRYAYWADDESSRMNVNLAWGRSAANTSRAGSMTRLNLEALTNTGMTNTGMTATLADEIHQAVTTNAYQTDAKFFNSPEDFSRLSAGAMGALLNNRFDVTHFNHDPDTTFFNKPRIVLTTKFAVANPGLAAQGFNRDSPGIKSNPKYRPYLEILKDEAVDPADYGNIDTARTKDTMALIKSYLERTDWPFLPGKSFQDKYYNSYPPAQQISRINQLALNIVEYVRAKEMDPAVYSDPQNKEGIFAPMRGIVGSDGSFSILAGGGSNSITALTRTPVITELGIHLSSDLATFTIKTELYLPPQYGLDQVTVGAPFIGDNSEGLWYNIILGYDNESYSDTGSYKTKITPAMCSPDPVLAAGDYLVITQVIPVSSFLDRSVSPNISLNIPTRPTTLKIRMGLLLERAGVASDLVPIVGNYNLLIDMPVDPDTVAVNDITTVETSDPRVNKHKDDWDHGTGNTLGAPNQRMTDMLGSPAPATIVPMLDTDAAGNVTDYSIYMPPIKGSPGNLYGVVESIGELGYIHTGLEGSFKAGTPFRTFRLQQSTSSTVLPDWALMDLFTVPSEAPAASARQVFKPQDGSMFGGRVNLNGANVFPFSNSSRINPLVGVFLGADRNGVPITLPQAQTIAQNIRDHTGIYYPDGASNPAEVNNLYDSPGEVIEIDGVADGGEESEDIVRQVVNQLTTRGGVFSVYSIGQSLKQTPDGRLILQAEQRTQSFVERVLNSDGTIAARTIYHRSLNP